VQFFWTTTTTTKYDDNTNNNSSGSTSSSDDGDDDITIQYGDTLDGEIGPMAAANVILQSTVFQPYAPPRKGPTKRKHAAIAVA